MPFDGEHLGGDAADDGRGIARSGTHLQHFVAAVQFRRRQHGADNKGLGDGLAFRDRQGAVFISELFEAGGHKGLARHRAHGLQHGGVAHPTAGDLRFHHTFAGLGGIHWKTPNGR